jgi:drug/metabolite transporter (DMT)-like permease
MTGRTAGLTAATLVCFAANSLLCRAALRPGLADAATFTLVRMASGAVMLAALVRLRPGDRGGLHGGSWLSALALAGYALAFSFAYLRIDAGTGALVLFAAVQAGMIGWGIARGEHPRAREWVGLVLALAGLVLLARPGRTAPDPVGLALMVLAGLAWAAYSLRGRHARDPLGANADNFARGALLTLAAVVLAPAWQATPAGLTLAVGSGAVASGLGYTLWYAALRGLERTQAAVVQLAVPVLAAAGGVLLLGEDVTLRLVASGAVILGGIALALTARA